MEDCGHIAVWSGPRVEHTNARGRHRYCAPFKAWIVEQAMRAGMSTAGLAMRNQVNANQLRRWVMLERRRAAVAPSPTLLPVTIGPEALPAQPTITMPRAAASIEIELAGALVRVHEGVDQRHLKLVLEALRA